MRAKLVGSPGRRARSRPTQCSIGPHCPPSENRWTPNGMAPSAAGDRLPAGSAIQVDTDALGQLLLEDLLRADDESCCRSPATRRTAETASTCPPARNRWRRRAFSRRRLRRAASIVAILTSCKPDSIGPRVVLLSLTSSIGRSVRNCSRAPWPNRARSAHRRRSVRRISSGRLVPSGANSGESSSSHPLAVVRKQRTSPVNCLAARPCRAAVDRQEDGDLRVPSAISR